MSVELGMMVFGVVYNDNNTSTTLITGLPKVFEKRMERHRVKLFLFSLKDQFPVAQAHSPKITHAPTRGMVQHDRLLLLRGHPHKTTRSILLKMNLIGRPQIHPWIRREVSEFFYMPPEVQGWPGRSEGAVCADESQRI
jgi:hypothetical protein